MKIDRIEIELCSLPYVHFFETSLGREEDRTFILVKVYAEGICGYGETVADKAPLYSYETTQTAWLMLKDYLIPLLIRKSLSEPLDFYEEAKIFKGHPMAKAGLEMALWDLAAKQKGVPLWKLYGGSQKEIPSGVSIGIQDSQSQLIHRIQAFLEEGYQRIKLKIKPGWDVSVCRNVREKFPDIRLQVDANGAYVYCLDDKKRLLDLDTFGLEMIEQPFVPYDLWDHARLQEDLHTPLCLDESIINAETARKAMEMGSCRVINIKAGRVGGIIESKRIHDVCQKNSMPVWCGGMLESGIGRAHNVHLATLPNFKFPHDLSASKRYYAEDLIEPPIDITGQGTIKVPDLPGIGVSPQEKRIQKASQLKKIFKKSDF
ncbi:MAG: o-succinylbenzoate synthase [Candidatus Aminicenantes bacterium]|nr:MAG: o-succinylbenzoate synthase [Candidatus Aminicenantes bacterium]